MLSNKKHNLNRIYYSFILLFLVLSIGTIGYIIIEDYSFVEGFFMTIITISTVGFGEVKPLSDNGLIFTTFLIISSFGIFAYVITTITSYIIDGDFRTFIKKRRMEKELENVFEHVIVCGYGRNGKQAVNELITHDETVIVIEGNQEICSENENSNQNLFFINGDATFEEILLKAKVEKAKALITTLPSDANNLFVVLTAREFNPKMTIISRASDENSDTKLKRAGASNVIMPDKVGGTRMAKLVSQPDVVEFLENIMLKDGETVTLAEISCNDMPSCMLNKSIKEMDIRSLSGVNLLGIKTSTGAYIYNPSPEIKITNENKLFVLGTPKQINNFRKMLEGME